MDTSRSSQLGLCGQFSARTLIVLLGVGLIQMTVAGCKTTGGQSENPPAANSEILAFGTPKKNVSFKGTPRSPSAIVHNLYWPLPSGNGVFPLLVFISNNNAFVETLWPLQPSLEKCRTEFLAYRQRFRAKHGKDATSNLYCISIAGGKIIDTVTVHKSF